MGASEDKPELAEPPKATVVVPVFNTADYLDECLGSLVAQTLRNIEIICVDDGSTDGSPSKLAGWAEKDSRIRVFRQENRGGGAARNAGMDAATGEWLFFCDSDDACEPEMLEELVRTGDGADAQVVVAPRILWNETLEKTVSVTRLPERLLSSGANFSGRSVGSDLFVFSGSTAWNKLFRRDFVSENGIRFREVRTRSDDLGFVDLALALADRISACGRALYKYRSGRPGGAVDSSEKRNPLELFGAFSQLRDNLVSRGLFVEFAAPFAKALFVSAGYQISGFRFGESAAACHARLRETLLELRPSCDLAADGVLDERQRAAYLALLESADPLPFLLASWRQSINRAQALSVRAEELRSKWRAEARKRSETIASFRAERERWKAADRIRAKDLSGAKRTIGSLERKLSRIERSFSWRVTAPLRFLSGLLFRPSGGVRK